MLENKLSSVFGEVGRIAVFRQKPSDAATKAGEAVSGTVSKLKGMRGKVEDRIHQYMSSIGRPEFDYDRIRLDFEHILHDPKSSLKVLRARMKLYNRDSLIALLKSREGVSEGDVEQMVQKVEEARDNVIRRTENVRTRSAPGFAKPSSAPFTKPKTPERLPPPPPGGCSVANLPQRFDPPSEGRVFNLRKTRRSDARRELRLGAVF